MKVEDIKWGMKVYPISKTADGRSPGLETCTAWNRALKKGQDWLYVVKMSPLNAAYPEYGLSDVRESGGYGYDYFVAKDFIKYSDKFLSEIKVDEGSWKEYINSNYEPSVREDATNIAIDFEVKPSYFEQVWRKGDALIFALESHGYTLIKKTEL